MSGELERAVLGALIFNPALLKECELRDTDFRAGRCRKTYSAIAALWAESGPAEIDHLLLAERIGGDGAVAFTESLIDGNLKVDAPTFRGRVAEFRKWALTSKILGTIERQAKSGKLDLDEIRPDLETYDQLEGEAFDPYAFMRTGSQLQALDIHVDWTVDKLIPEGAITLLHGPAGLGKTWLCLAIAKAVSEGTPFLGLQTKKREVVYIDYENPLAIDHNRACTMNVCTPHFWHLSDPTRPPKLDGPDWELLKTLHRGSLIIIDTARGATDGDEIKGQDVALVMNRLKEVREFEHEIILQAHTSKANKKLSKGATTWEDLADHVLAFYRVRPGTLEEIEEEGFDPNALLYLGTGNKTRYEPCRYYVSLNPANGTFTLVKDPNAEAINALAGYIAGDGGGQNQSEIVKWAKDAGVGSRQHGSVIALLWRGEREGRWRSRKGLRGARFYEPST